MSRKLSGQLGVLGSGVAIGFALRLVQSALVARLLGINEFGKFATVAALMAIVSRLNDLGLPNTVAYYFRRSRGAFRPLMRVAYLDFILCWVVSLALVALLPRFPLAISPDLRDAPVRQLILAAYIAVNTPTWILPGFVTAAADYTAYARLTNLDAGLQALFSVSACLVLGPSYFHVVAALAVEQCLMTCVYLWFVRRYSGLAPDDPVSPREIISYGVRLQWGVVMKLISSRADILTVGALTNARLAGLYSVALNIRDIGLLPQSVYAAPFQNLVIDRSRDEKISDRPAVMTGLLLQLLLSIAMAVAAALALPLLIPAVYGSAFQAAVAPAVVLFASVVFLGPAGLCWMTFNAKGRPHLTSLQLTAAGIVGPGLTYLLIKTGHGLLGAAWGGVATAALTFILCIVFLQRLQHYRREDIRAGWKRVRSLMDAAVLRAKSALAGPPRG
ncbi:MAG: oligosaccharide flippase family protein [Gemmatimonadales bacterium]